MTPRSQALALSGLLLLGLLARLVATGLFQDGLLTDPDGYVAMAADVAGGAGIVGPFTGRPTAFRPPAYPLVLGGLFRIGLPQNVAVIMLHAVCGLITIWLTWRLSGACGLTGIWQLMATACVAADPLLLRYTALPMTEVASACLLTLAVLNWQQTFSDADRAAVCRRAWSGPLVTGIVFGLLAMMRPIGFVVTALLCGRAAVRSARRKLRSILLTGVAAGLVVLPWVIRNAVHFEQFIPATTHGGYTLALGNNPSFYRDVIRKDSSFWDGGQLASWQQQVQRLATESGVDASDEPAMDQFMYDQAKAAIRADPESFVRACLYRLRRFWSTRPVHALAAAEDTTAEQGQPAAVSSVLRIAAALTSVWYSLLWIGVVLSLWSVFGRNSTGAFTTLWLTVLAFLCVHCFYWTDARMRTPVMPVLCILAAAGWQTLFAIFGLRSPKPDACHEQSFAQQV